MKIKKLIICDDDKNYCDSLAGQFLRESWILEYTRSLEDFIPKMNKEADEFFAVILDIKGMIRNTDEKEKVGFIGDALTFLDKNHPHVPRVILSAEKKDFENVKIYHPNEKVFQKETDDQDALQTLLKEYADNSEIYKIRAKEPILYETFEKGYLPDKSKPKLDNLLKHVSHLEIMKPAHLFNQCREILEDVFSALNKKSDSYLPNEFFTGKKLNFNNCIRFLNGQDVNIQNYRNRVFQRAKVIPDFVGSAMYLVHNNSGEGLHTGEVKPSSYTEMTTIYACLDCLKWFKDFMDSKDPFKD